MLAFTLRVCSWRQSVKMRANHLEVRQCQEESATPMFWYKKGGHVMMGRGGTYLPLPRFP